MPPLMANFSAGSPLLQQQGAAFSDLCGTAGGCSCVRVQVHSLHGMKEHLETMKVSLRVLTALNEMYAPDPDDVEVLRNYIGANGLWELDDLACEAIKRALWARDRIRAAIRGERLTPVS